jgi:tubulin delta
MREKGALTFAVISAPAFSASWYCQAFAILQEVDAAPHFTGFLLLQSAAGGTGSGLGTLSCVCQAVVHVVRVLEYSANCLSGSFLAELLRAHFPDALLFSVVVWPFRSGEVCVQSYNSVLTMASLSRVIRSLLWVCVSAVLV